MNIMPLVMNTTLNFDKTHKMLYYGGKVKQGKKIAGIIQEYVSTNDRGPVDHYVEPFAGCLGVTRHLVSFLDEQCIQVHVSDGCPDIIALWQSLQNGTFDRPGPVTREIWQQQRYLTEPSAFRAYVGFGHSFNGIFFGAYQPNTYKEGKLYSNLCTLAPRFKSTKFKHLDYRQALRDIPNGDRCVIYCDPPYAKGTYRFGSTHGFDHGEFVQTVEEWVKCGHAVFVSEQEFPFGRVVHENTRHCVRRSSEGHMYTDYLYLID